MEDNFFSEGFVEGSFDDGGCIGGNKDTMVMNFHKSRANGNQV